MGGPSCRIVLRERLSDGGFRDLEMILTKFGTVRREERILNIFDPSSGGNVELSLSEPNSPYWGSLPRRMRDALGWPPAQIIEAWGTSRAPINHRYLGGVALELAKRFNGMIHLLTICPIDDDEGGPQAPPELLDHLDRYRSRRHPEDRDLPEAMVAGLEAHKEVVGPWIDEIKLWLREKAREHIARSPGKVVEFDDEEGGENYLVDSDYMQVWLNDPGFYFE
jgi:hypothetical protein